MINTYNNSRNISFTAGLNNSVKKRFAEHNAKKIAKALKNVYGIDADFGYNRAIACCCGTTADIFADLSRRFGFPFTAVPPKIRTFMPENLALKLNKTAVGFCISDTTTVFKNQKPYELRSLFINDNYNALIHIDKIAEENYKAGWFASNHFLQTFIHEWTHNIHFDLLYKAFGYDGHCPIGRQMYNTRNGMYYDPNPFVSGIQKYHELRNKQYGTDKKEYIFNKISGYAAGLKKDLNTGKSKNADGGNPLEVVAEHTTKAITDVLDPYTLMPTRNPFVAYGKEDGLLKEILNKAWNGIIGN